LQKEKNRQQAVSFALLSLEDAEHVFDGERVDTVNKVVERFGKILHKTGQVFRHDAHEFEPGMQILLMVGAVAAGDIGNDLRNVGLVRILCRGFAFRRNKAGERGAGNKKAQKDSKYFFHNKTSFLFSPSHIITDRIRFCKCLFTINSYYWRIFIGKSGGNAQTGSPWTRSRHRFAAAAKGFLRFILCALQGIDRRARLYYNKTERKTAAFRAFGRGGKAKGTDAV
jgi:hypothetical protein